MAKPRKTPPAGAIVAASEGDEAPVANTVTIIMASKVHKGTVTHGQADTFDVGDVIPVTEAQAESLRAQGYAE